MSRAGQHHGGVPHGPRCACPTCDPKQTRVAAARAAAAASRGEPVTPIVQAPPRPPGPPPAARYEAARRRSEADPKMRRARELIRQGKSMREAIEIIESETPMGGDHQ